MYKIIYLPTAEFVSLSNFICSDRNEKALLEVIQKYPAYYPREHTLFFTNSYRDGKLGRYLIPKHLLEVIKV